MPFSDDVTKKEDKLIKEALFQFISDTKVKDIVLLLSHWQSLFYASILVITELSSALKFSTIEVIAVDSIYMVCSLCFYKVKYLLLLLLLLHPFNGLFSRTIWVSRHQKGKPFWILLEQEMMGWQWHQLDRMQTICSSLQTDNYASTSHLSFYRPDALSAAQPTASKHWRQKVKYRHCWKLARRGP